MYLCLVSKQASWSHVWLSTMEKEAHFLLQWDQWQAMCVSLVSYCNCGLTSLLLHAVIRHMSSPVMEDEDG